MKTLKHVTGALFALGVAVTGLTFVVLDPFAEPGTPAAQAKATPRAAPEAEWQSVRTAFETCGSLLEAERRRLEADTRRALEAALEGLILALPGQPQAKEAFRAELSQELRARRDELGLDLLCVLTEEDPVPAGEPDPRGEQPVATPDALRRLLVEAGGEQIEACALPAGFGEDAAAGGVASGSGAEGIYLIAEVPVREEGETARSLLLGGRSLEVVSAKIQEGLRDRGESAEWRAFLGDDSGRPVVVAGRDRGRMLRKDILEKLEVAPEVESPSALEGGRGASLEKFGRIYASTGEVVGGWGVSKPVPESLALPEPDEVPVEAPRFTRLHWFLALGATVLLGLLSLALSLGGSASLARGAPAGPAKAAAEGVGTGPSLEEKLLAEFETSWKTFAYYMNQLISRSLAAPDAARGEDAEELRRRLEGMARGLGDLRAEVAEATARVEELAQNLAAPVATLPADRASSPSAEPSAHAEAQTAELPPAESPIGPPAGSGSPPPEGSAAVPSAEPQAEAPPVPPAPRFGAPAADVASDAAPSSEAILRKLESDVGYLAALLPRVESDASIGSGEALGGAGGEAQTGRPGTGPDLGPVLVEGRTILRTIEAGLREARRLNQALVTELANVRGSEASLRLDLLETAAREAALRRELETDASRRQEALDEKGDSVRREGDIAVSLKAAEKRRADAEARAASLEASLEALKRELEDARGRAAKDRDELEAARREASETKSQELEAEAHRLASELESSQAELAGSKAELDSLRARLDSVRAELESARGETDRAKAETASLAQALEAARAAADEWRVRAESLGGERKALEERVAQLEGELRSGAGGGAEAEDARAAGEFRAERDRLAEDLAASRSKAEETTERLRKLEADLAAERARSNRSEQECRRLASRVSALQTALDAARPEKERLEAEKDRLARELEVEKKRAEDAPRREEEIHALRVRIRALEETSRASAASIRAKEDEVAKLRKELEDALARVAVQAAPEPSPEAAGAERDAALEARSRALYEESLERSFPAALIVLDSEDRIVSWSQAAAALFGVPADDAVGKRLSEVESPLGKEAFQRRFEENKRDGATHLLRVRLPAGGKPEPYFVTQAPLLGPDESQKGSILLLQPASAFVR